MFTKKLSPRFIVITSLLLALAAITVNADWGSGFTALIAPVPQTSLSDASYETKANYVEYAIADEDTSQSIRENDSGGFMQPGDTAIKLKSESLILDNVTISVQQSVIPPSSSFTTSAPGDAIQAATAFTNNPFREICIIAVPFGLAAPSENLGVSRAGGAYEYEASLKAFRREQGRLLDESSNASIFGNQVSGFSSVVPLPLNGTEVQSVLMTEWVAEAGERLWIVRVSQEDSSQNRTYLSKTLQRQNFSIDSDDLDQPTTLQNAQPSNGPRKLARIDAPDDLPQPYWWNGYNCDWNWYNAQTGVQAVTLGAVYLGMPACGPRPAYGGPNPGPIRTLPGGHGEYEWQCVELVMRFMYLKYGINAYGANGNTVVSNYSGSVLQKVTNGTAGRAPLPGDVISYALTSPNGHTSVVTSSNVDGNGNGSITVIEQNYSSTGSRTLNVSNWSVQSSLNATGWLHDPSSGVCSISVGQGASGSELTAFQNAYTTGGGQAVLGCANQNVQTAGFTSFAGTSDHYQQTSGGDLEYHTNGPRAGQSFAVISPFLTKWSSFGYTSNNPLGLPIGFVSQSANSCYNTQNRYQSFEGGSLTQHLSGSSNGSIFEAHGAIHRKWEQLGFAICPMGVLTSDETTANPSGATGSTGKLNQFEGGQIYWKTNAANAYEVHGSIYQTYVNLGGSPSCLGFPTSDEFVSNGYPRNNFEGGYITTLNGSTYQAFGCGTATPTNTPTRTPTATPTGTPFSTARTAFDFDGDGKADISVYRPSTGIWYIQGSQAGFYGSNFGLSNDMIVPADYDGDGKTDYAVYRPSTGIWYIQRSNLGFTAYQFGLSTDIPMPADYDGDGKADIAVYRPSNGRWYLLRTNLGYTEFQFGLNGDRPVSRDYDGDGKADIAVYRPSSGFWYIARSSLGYVQSQFGLSGDREVPADYDGDGKADIAVYRPSNGVWYINRSSLGYMQFPFGLSADEPVPADYDGDGKADIAVYRPSNGYWYLQRTSAGYTGYPFGLSTDQPIPNAYVR